MRCQLATLETVLAVVVSVYAISYYAYVVRNYDYALSSSMFALRASAAAYDLSSAIEANASAKACVELSSAQCLKGIVLQYERVYGIGIGVYLNGMQAGSEQGRGALYCFYFYNKTLCMLFSQVS
ncbi:MAG: hypothetical protein QXT43_02700 [Candidatus Micrarchaeaceae archaeon]